MSVRRPQDRQANLSRGPIISGMLGSSPMYAVDEVMTLVASSGSLWPSSDLLDRLWRIRQRHDNVHEARQAGAPHRVEGLGLSFAVPFQMKARLVADTAHGEHR